MRGAPSIRLGTGACSRLLWKAKAPPRSRVSLQPYDAIHRLCSREKRRALRIALRIAFGSCRLKYVTPSTGPPLLLCVYVIACGKKTWKEKGKHPGASPSSELHKKEKAPVIAGSPATLSHRSDSVPVLPCRFSRNPNGASFLSKSKRSRECENFRPTSSIRARPCRERKITANASL